ncbi:sigma-70 family RNA polymerase sigma factor [Nocardioides sp. ChNu-153]|uniref:sigma-70 family RNA polymerase sigma factor n=1 Tax=unclassified Nocardioides TaxID=2615069 RepID=UPI002406EC09|nr:MULTISPECIES: sigma-70 family RNA polymerase sigma factor [unclassified Nocardioides]MDF9714592.1 sigma-70 family RNA polymerase sigma factor [Nocardioides sp. ChNu-99]MDN7119874.1 sigma-70 family RNA polymerase sigma factor [Nocardioides sp. ChNu-153]
MPNEELSPTTPVTSARQSEREQRRAATAASLEAAGRATDQAERDAALRELVVANMGVARSLAARQRNRGIPIEDLEQVAYLALVRAADGFDVTQGKDFLTYAVPCIRGELRRHFRDHGWMVRPPRQVQENQSAVIRARDRLTGDHGENVPAAVIARELEIEVDVVEQALAAEGCFRPVSLDAPLPTGVGARHEETVVDPAAEQELIEARETLRPALRQLGERERRILMLRYFNDRTQQEIADELGITQTQVSRLLAGILRQLREVVGAPAATQRRAS